MREEGRTAFEGYLGAPTPVRMLEDQAQRQCRRRRGSCQKHQPVQRGHHCCCHLSPSAQQVLGSGCCHLLSLNSGRGRCPLQPIRILHCPKSESSGCTYLIESKSQGHASADHEGKAGICLFSCNSKRVSSTVQNSTYLVGEFCYWIPCIYNFQKNYLGGVKK